MKPYYTRHPSQRGIVLISGIVMLVMMTLIAISMIRLGTRHTQIVNNEQLRTEAESAATYALDLMLNDSATTWDVYREAGKTEAINIGLNDMSATSTAAIDVRLHDLTCRRVRIMKNSEFIKTNAGMNYISEADSSCFGGDTKQLTIVDTSSAASGEEASLCATALFEVRAETNDPQLLEANVEMTQGVEVRRSVLNLGTCD